MSVSIPYINPVRFQKEDIVIDNQDVMPFQDNMRLREKYQRGIEPINYFCDWIVGNELSFIVWSTIQNPSFVGKAFLYNYETGERENVSFSREYATPSGFSGNVVKHTYTLSKEGLYYIRLADGTVDPDIYISDVINIRSNDNKGLVKVNFNDTQNRHGGYFFSASNTEFWNPIMYYTGQIIPVTPEDEPSVYDDELGNVIPLSHQPKRISSLNITDVHNTYIDVIFQQTLCDTRIINGIKYYASDFEVTQKENSDVVTITIKLTMQENEYFFKYE